MNAEALKRRTRRAGFSLLELARIDGRRFLVIETRHGLIVKGDDEKPLTLEEVVEFLEPFEDREWIPG